MIQENMIHDKLITPQYTDFKPYKIDLFQNPLKRQIRLRLADASLI